jgi:hypothetical protein
MHDMNRIIGIDFDNTIVGYDALMRQVGQQRGLLPPSGGKSKKEIRDIIRSLPEGEMEWRKLQAIVYGPRMAEAELIEGVPAFFQLCRENKVTTFIVSHKTEYAGGDGAGINLRAAALAWMEKKSFFERLGLAHASVHFEATRAAKVDRIRRLRCTHFIDDLEETFLEEIFPPSVAKILYSPHDGRSSVKGAKVFGSWTEIADYFFGAEGRDGRV